MHHTRLFNRRIFPASDDPGQLGTFQHNLWLYNGPRFEGIYNSTIFLTRKLRFICVNAITNGHHFTVSYGFFPVAMDNTQTAIRLRGLYVPLGVASLFHFPIPLHSPLPSI